MITSIEIKNFSSIRKASIVFEKAKYKFKEEYILNNKTANPIALFGSNGSGKSSFLNSMRDLVSMLISEVDKLVPFIPNLSDTATSKTISSIQIEMNLDGQSYLYYISTTFKGISYEKLVKGRRKLFERTEKSVNYNGEKIEIESPFFPALRYLSNRFVSDSEIVLVYEFLSNIGYVGAESKLYLVKGMENISEKDVLVNRSNEVRKILESYGDFPIYDIVSKTEKTGKKTYSVNIQKETDSFTIPYDLMSSGMRNQSFLLSVLLSLPKNGVLVVDELEDALHPFTIMNFINFAVKNGVQLIFSSHNTSILTHLRPDNIVFSHWKNGESRYKRLSDIYPNIRLVNNIEKMYLSSTFDEEIKK